MTAKTMMEAYFAAFNKHDPKTTCAATMRRSRTPAITLSRLSPMTTALLRASGDSRGRTPGRWGSPRLPVVPWKCSARRSCRSRATRSHGCTAITTGAVS